MDRQSQKGVTYIVFKRTNGGSYFIHIVNSRLQAIKMKNKSKTLDSVATKAILWTAYVKASVKAGLDKQSELRPGLTYQSHFLCPSG